MQLLFVKLLRFIQRLLRFSLRQLNSVEHKVLEIIPELNKSLQESVVTRSTKYDMSTAADEPYYLKQYEYWIKNYILESKNNFNPRNALDLGCGQARLLKPLAKLFPNCHFVGVDLSQAALDIAQHDSQEIKNVSFFKANILEYLDNIADNSQDLICMTEVTFFFPDWLKAFDKIKLKLKKNGFLIMSFRPLYFYALMLTRARFLSELELLSKVRKAKLSLASLELTWQTSHEIRDLFSMENGFELKCLNGIGCLSGIANDPHDYICKPSLLNLEESQVLQKIELELASLIPDCGRYMLAIAHKIT